MSAHEAYCSPECPALTGEAIHDVRYCPMASPEALARHRNLPLIGAESPRKARRPGARGFGPETWVRDTDGDPIWVIRDWRDGTDKPVRIESAPDGVDSDTDAPIPMVRFVHAVPRHPDFTSCCADFRCCSDKWDRAGMSSIRDALVSGAPSIAVARVEGGAVALNTPPTTEEL